MPTFTANEAKTRSEAFLDGAQHYEAMRQFHADRLLRIMAETAKAAQEAGLAPEKLAELLADQS